MGHTARYFVSQEVYSITFRTIEGLPFVATAYMKLLLEGIMAQAQRDNKVIICHYIWMANHVHIMVIIQDPEQAHRFYGEVQKKITDSVKKLLNLESLRLWEGRPSAPRVLDFASAKKQIAYFYANPARANLVDTMSEYPGASSWSDFQEMIASNAYDVDTKIERNVTWVPYSKVPPLPAPSLKKHADVDFTSRLAALGRVQPLKIYPNAWMRCFGITDPQEVAKVNKDILAQWAANEEEHRTKRREEKKGVIGERELRVQSILKAHVPKDRKTRRRIFVICSDRDQRIRYIRKVKRMCRIAHSYYLDALQGINRFWPPGMFRPPMRALASALM